jgi:transposase
MELDSPAFEQLDRDALVRVARAQQARITELAAQVAALTAQVQALTDAPPQSPPPSAPNVPPFVRPTRPDQPAKPRKPRTQQFVRHRDRPTQLIEHGVAHCPGCHTPLQGGEVVRRRQVLHLPRVPVQVIEHVVRRRICPRCNQAVTPTLDLSDQVVGQHRVSSETIAYIASLHTIGRLPLRTIQWLLETVHGLHLGLGTLVGLLRTVARRAEPVLAELRAQVRGSPVIHADETGWRENGVNGWLWTFSTPELRYFHYERSRAGTVVQEVLGADYRGTLVSDFYSAYNSHVGSHQRCWVHLLRDIHDLCTTHPEDTALAAWAQAVHDLYLEAKVAANHADWTTRVAARARFETALFACCRPGLEPETRLPQRTLCQRIDRFLAELFPFVIYPAVPADNNLAERSLRPLVVARKISGGTRSPQGSRVRMALASLFGTWQAQGRNPLDACHQLLLAPAL